MNPKNIFFYEIISTQLASSQVDGPRHNIGFCGFSAIPFLCLLEVREQTVRCVRGVYF